MCIRDSIQAGGFGEHRFTTVTYDRCTSEYPGSHKNYAPAPITAQREHLSAADPVGDRYLQVILPPGAQIRLDLTMARYVSSPNYGLPW